VPIVLAILGIVAVVLLWRWAQKKQQALYRVNDRFGQLPNEMEKGNLDSIRKYWETKQSVEPNPLSIDKLTWNDLSMDAVFHRINMCGSSVGEEYLYTLLHEPTTDLDALNRRETLLRELGLRPELRKKLQTILVNAGKTDNNGLASFLFDIETKRLDNVWRYRVQALAPLAALGVMFFSIGPGIILLITAVILNTWTYYKQQWRMDEELNAINYLTAILTASGKIAAIKDDSIAPYADTLRESGKAFRALSNKLIRLFDGADWNFLLEYVKLLFMYDFLRFNGIINTLRKHNKELRAMWDTLGELDAMISVLSFRQSLQTCAVPEWTDTDEVVLTDIWHPLIENAARNSLTLDKNCFVTGSNASGKSTFIKAAAINAILAQTIHTCTARGYKAKPCHVLTSMAVKDDVVEGDSYFIAEIKSLRRVMDAIANENVRCFCFIDEILKGTNTVERIAASAAIAQYLLGKNCLCMVATHDIELPGILGESFQNVHFSENVTDEGVTFSYQIHNGVSQTRNAIHLLDFMEFDKTIVTSADSMVQWYVENKKWKNV